MRTRNKRFQVAILALGCLVILLPWMNQTRLSSLVKYDDYAAVTTNMPELLALLRTTDSMIPKVFPREDDHTIIPSGERDPSTTGGQISIRQEHVRKTDSQMRLNSVLQQPKQQQQQQHQPPENVEEIYKITLESKRKFLDASGDAAVQEALSQALENASQYYNLIRKGDGFKEFNRFLFLTGQLQQFCEEMNNNDDSSSSNNNNNKKKQLLSMTVDCTHLQHGGYAGTGNYLLMIYTLRLAVRALGFVDLAMTCSSTSYEFYHRIIFPWVMGWFPSSSSSSLPFPLASQVCQNATPPLNYMIPEIQYDLRRLAIAHLGIPGPWHPSYHWVQDVLNQQRKSQEPAGIRQVVIPSAPLYPNERIDDAVIHFRCGDILQNGHRKYGYLKYNSYAKRILPHANRIGILSLPFPIPFDVSHVMKFLDEAAKGAVLRKQDRKISALKRCSDLVLPFQAYLQQRFPNATVIIHNSKHETPSLSYARMIMANQTFSTMSTFGLFGALATFGTGYLYKPQPNVPHLNDFLLQQPPLEETYPNLKFMDDEQLDSKSMVMLWDYTSFLAKKHQHITGKLGTEGLLEWFQNETLHFNSPLSRTKINLIVQKRFSELPQHPHINYKTLPN